MSEDTAENAASYQPPTIQTTNSNVADNASIAALVEQLVRERLAASGVTATEPPKVLTPEEQARVAIDNKGAGLGVEERLAELYRHLDTIAKKVGI